MWISLTGLVVAVVIAVFVTSTSSTDPDVAEGEAFLARFEKDAEKVFRSGIDAAWDFSSNITEETKQKQIEAVGKEATFIRKIWEEAQRYPWRSYQGSVYRRFEKMSFLGTAALSEDRLNEFENLKATMQQIYSEGTVCDYLDPKNCTLRLEPEITLKIAESQNEPELKHLWVSWRNATGRKLRSTYKKYVDFSNEVAKKNNYSNAAESWTRDYEASDFTNQIDELWNQLKPLYEQLQAYVRRQLRKTYGEEVVSKTGPIPAHLLGDVWAQNWQNIAKFTIPFPNKQSIDVTPALVEQGYTPVKIFELAEEFFTSLGLPAMPDTFWKYSILERPKDGRNLTCHASAWDFYDGKDFRIKQCTDVNHNHLRVAHHEMGHVEYFIQYKDQPYHFRQGANPGFHEAVGDVIALSVGTPSHLHKIKLLPEIKYDRESDLNDLFQVALEKIAFLPFAYTMDQYRWSLFRGDVNEEDYNCHWWKLREKNQGIQPPVARSENDFDPGAKYHIVGDVPYIRYFVSFVIQFQFHQALCEAAGQFQPNNPDAHPLHMCDIHGSKEAGKLLGEMLKMGSSKPWPDAMEAITGQRKMDATSILLYFKPLQKWLEDENKRSGEHIGWTPSTIGCKK